MKIKELLEAKVNDLYTSAVDPSMVLDLLQTHCSQALHTMGKTPMARFSRKGYEIVSIVDPTVGERKSQNTTNQYTLLMDNSPYMKDFPKRSRSIICHSIYPPYYESGASDNMYMIYPFDNTVIGVCPDEDLWDTKVTIPGLGLHDRSWETMNNVLQKLHVPDDSYAELYAYMKSDDLVEAYHNFTKYMKSLGGRSYPMNKEVFVPLEDPKMLLEHIQYCMRPEVTGLSVTSIGAWRNIGKKECWIGGKFLAISSNYFFKELLGKNILDRIL